MAEEVMRLVSRMGRDPLRPTTVIATIHQVRVVMMTMMMIVVMMMMMMMMMRRVVMMMVMVIEKKKQDDDDDDDDDSSHHGSRAKPSSTCRMICFCWRGERATTLGPPRTLLRD
jgi:hypothetical protein